MVSQISVATESLPSKNIFQSNRPAQNALLGESNASSMPRSELIIHLKSGECQLNHMDFEILPHTLRASQPKKNCTGDSQPQIDFSKGFPVPWILSFTDIHVPSQHTMGGKRYDAEVVLSHTYTVEKHDRLVSAS